MSQIPRVVVFKLLYGGYLRRDGYEGSYDRSAALHLYYPDAIAFWRALHPRDRSDKLWGMSLELLPKRKRRGQHPLNPQQFQQHIVAMQTARLLADADKYDRMAEGYLFQAKHSEQRAAEMRAKAQALRDSLTVKS